MVLTIVSFSLDIISKLSVYAAALTGYLIKPQLSWLLPKLHRWSLNCSEGLLPCSTLLSTHLEGKQHELRTERITGSV